MKTIKWPITAVFDWHPVSAGFYVRKADLTFYGKGKTWRHGSAYLWRLKIVW